jgi:Protein of unknown function (DUF2009)
MNPGKMRNTYGKLMWILMDTESYTVKSHLKVREREGRERGSEGRDGSRGHSGRDGV